MMAMGEAAGVASAIALRDGVSYPAVPVEAIRTTLGIPAFIDKITAIWKLSVT